MNKDQIDGRKKAIAGKVKEITGKIVGNKAMEIKGKVKGKLGEAQADYGDAKSKLKKT